MAREDDTKVRARLLPETTLETKTATLAVRPLRLAFLVRARASEEDVLTYLAYCSSVWGGVFNALIPTDGESLTEDWWRVIRAHDPDKVVCCGPISPALRREVEDTVQPFAVVDWTDRGASEHSSGLATFGSVPMGLILWHVYKLHRPVEESNIRMVTPHQAGPLALCAAAQFGTVDEELSRIYGEGLRAQQVDLGLDDFEQYLDVLTQFRDRLSPLDMTKWNLSTFSEEGIAPPGFNLVLLSATRWVEDLCVFWNLRMVPQVVYRESVLAPIELLRGKKNLQRLADWCNANVGPTNHLNLVSTTVPPRRLRRLSRRLKGLLIKRLQQVHIWHGRFGISKFRVYESEQARELRIENRTFSFFRPEPSFSDSIRANEEWVADVDFRGRRYLGKGYIPPRYAGVCRLLSGEPSDWTRDAARGYWARLAHDRLSFRVRRATDHVRMQLPEDEKLFDSLLGSKGYSCRTTDKCRYTQGITRLLGRYDDAVLLQDERVRVLLDAMRDRKPYTLDEMKAVVKPGQEHGWAEALAWDLAHKGVFLRGYAVRCPACDLTHWYPTDALAERMPCAGCLAEVQPPVNAPFSYRLNELLVRGLEQGVVPVLLTLLVLSRLGTQSFLFVPGVEVEKDRQALDIDVLAACNGQLLVAECKDLRGGCASVTIQEIVDGIGTMAETVVDLGARLIFLSTLLDTPPPELQRGLGRIARRHKNLVIQLILKSDMERGFLTMSASQFLTLRNEERALPASLHDLLPRQRPRDDGWIREPGRRWVSTG